MLEFGLGTFFGLFLACIVAARFDDARRVAGRAARDTTPAPRPALRLVRPAPAPFDWATDDASA